MKTLLILLVKSYQWGLSPWLGHHCRFHPTCSHYAIEALHRYGAMRGTVLTLRRLARCHPWHPGGVDPLL
ncbi:membrane protein insertion efficiency factor YidD [Methylophilus medardicus]|uniref:Putative membrane protein insertion efficiency factor n=1 Tax=Methylophilus medardicus TaxID=2588534 RepID=A0A5B8CV89_9PROT|nr:membrane protein insertion efficiency factor YidD [Methylophilus medardicus]QDC45231.1 membrane protein insertion efficiency factor YidD [Methylophilus medardicus]QDC50238.1 membrane protein insertion efficiency factor YidD [Methylophilus medardicus]QDC53943.1 membrane protein insertion efficiency factor YidD [Methylophilus medardicus]